MNEVSNDRKSDSIGYIGISPGGIEYYITQRRCKSMDAKKKGIEAEIGNNRNESVDADQGCDNN